MQERKIGSYCQEVLSWPVSEVAACHGLLQTVKQGAPHPGYKQANADAAEMQGTMV